MKNERKGNGGLTSIKEIRHPDDECESEESEKDHRIFEERHRVNCIEKYILVRFPFS